AELVQVALIETGQGGDGENLQIAAACRGGGLHDALVAVHGDEVDVACRQSRHGAAHSGWNIEQFQVDKHFLVACLEPVDKGKEAVGHEQLQANLVERDTGIELFDQSACLRGVGHVQGHDEAFAGGRHQSSPLQVKRSSACRALRRG